MDLLERYLQSVGEYLPARSKADTLAELRENLLAEMESREEELGRALTENETAEVLEKHGRPVLVAARYLPQQHLIGPAWFPIYWFALKKSFPFVVLIYVATQCITWFSQGEKGVDLGAVVGHFPGVILTFWAVLTLGFACFEYAEGRYFHRVDLSKGWNPNELPKLEPAQGRQPSLVNRVANAVMAAVGIVWLLALPYMLLGPRLGYLRQMPFTLTPDWHIVYWQMIFLLAVQLVLKTAMVFLHTARGWYNALEVIVQVSGLVILVIMLRVRTYLVPGTTPAAMSLKDVTGLNALIHLGFQIALVVAVVKLLWDLWKMVTGSRTSQKGFVTVL